MPPGRRRRSSVVGLACLAIFHAAPGRARPADPVVVQGLSPADMFALADRMLAEGEKASAVAVYEALSSNPSVEIRSEARFRRAALLANEGKIADAAVLLRRILDEQPKASRVRLELARLLVMMGKTSEARAELRQAQAAGLPENVAVVVDKFARALSSRAPFGGSLEMTLAPDSNINRATSAETFDTIIAPFTLSDDARETSGVGAKVAGSGFARVALARNLDLIPRVNAVANLYDREQFNDLTGEAAIGADWRVRGNQFSPQLGFAVRRFGGEPYSRTWSAALRLTAPLGRTAQANLSLGTARVRFAKNDLQDGRTTIAGLALDKALNATSGARVSLSLSRHRAADPGYSTWSRGVGILGWTEAARATLFAEADLRWLDSDRAIFLFGRKRDERMIDVGVGATLRAFEVGGFAPVVRLGYQRNRSTVGIYDYSRRNAEIGVRRAF